MSTEEQVAVNENPMRAIRVEKIVLNIGVGKSGEQFEKAKTVLTSITGVKRIWERRARRTIREFGIRKREPIGVAVTLRGKIIESILPRLLNAVGMKLNEQSFVGRTVSYGIREYIEIPGVKYDPNIGIFGMDVTIVLERPGYRVSRRKRRTSKVGSRAMISSEETADFLSSRYGVKVLK
jgi:large subunit ribosomal protein L5